MRVWHLIAVATLAAAAWLALGCSNGGIVYENKLTGERVTVNQPPKSVAPATLSRGMTNSQPSSPNPSPWQSPLSASTGQQQTRDYAGEAQTASLTWVGIALLLAGIGGMVARIYLPVIPLSASLLAMGGGLLFLMLPGLLGQPVLLWSILGAVGGLAALGWLDNRSKLKAASAASSTTTSKPSQP